MAPDRGNKSGAGAANYQTISPVEESRPKPNQLDGLDENEEETEERQTAKRFLKDRAQSDTNFTLRGVLVGLAIGIIICFSNTYFGLQTGWVSGMAMPASLLGFAFFRSIRRILRYPFTPVENVLVQTVAGAVGTMPLGVGCVGVLPALNFLLEPSENGPIDLGLPKLVIWSVGICFLGVFVAVPLRKEVIIREKLRFPSGTATALMIGVLHGEKENADDPKASSDSIQSRSNSSELDRLDDDGITSRSPNRQEDTDDHHDRRNNWKSRIRLLIIAFGISAIYTLVSFFIPQIHDIPILGLYLANHWLWTFNPSPAYVGQGIIMGCATTTHMLFGAILGWGVLSPLAKKNGWAAGEVDDWGDGSKGWIVWVSLAIMLADSVANIGWLVLRPLIQYGPQWMASARDKARRGDLRSVMTPRVIYSRLQDSDTSTNPSRLDPGHAQEPSGSSHDTTKTAVDDLTEPDAPPEHLVSNRVVLGGFIVAIALTVAGVHVAFTDAMPFWATMISIVFSLVLSLMGVRALGETDLNPVSGISKLTQLAFAAFIPRSSPNAITINLIAGAISESAALQAGDLMQDLKAGHLLGASPAAQFWGQLIGSFVGAITSAVVYKLYTSVYTIPGGLFQVPTGFVWIFTARLVTGKGLPPMAWQFAIGAGVIWVILTALRIYGKDTWWVKFVPGGIAVAVGMYNVPSFTLARAIGGATTAYWVGWKNREEETVVVLASGLILGEGVVSILNLALASLRVPHL